MNMENTSKTLNQTISDLSPIWRLFGLSVAIAICSISILSNLFATFVIFVSKNLRTPCFHLIAVAAMGACACAINFLILCGYDLGLGLGLFNLELPAWHCFLIQGLISLFGVPFHAVATCLVGFDRFLSLAIPIRYRIMSKKFAMYSVISTILIILIFELIGIITAPMTGRVLCRAFQSGMDPIFRHIFAGIMLALCILNVVIYGAMRITLRYRTNQLIRSQENNESRHFMKQQTAVLPAVNTLTSLYFIFAVLPEFLINIAFGPYLDRLNGVITEITLIFYLLKCTGCLAEVMSLTVCCKRFRECSKSVIGYGGPTTITPAMGQSPTQWKL